MSHWPTALLFVLIFPVTTTATDHTPFKITTGRDNDHVQSQTENDRVVFSIHSPFGISHAVIERTSEKWPTSVVLRLYLKGLESFQASNGAITLAAAASSRDAKVRQWKHGKEHEPLDANSPLWMRVRLVGVDGKPAPTIPLPDSYFEIQLPEVLLVGNPPSIKVSWIDFYRN